MLDLRTYLEKKKHLIDAALGDRMPQAESRPRTLHAAMRYAVFSGGKRLRPILCLAAADAVGGSAEAALPAALAVELLHTYTLVHDDLPCMDDDSLRRGKPTCHIRFGVANAVLAGDALQALAFELASEVAAPAPCAAGQVVAELATAAGSRGVVGGQVEDIAFEAQGADADTVAFIHEHKTADLFRAAVRMGAIAGGASGDALAELTTYALSLGLAFQIADDLLDADSEKRDPMSCLGVYGVSGARERAAQHVAAAVASLAGLDPAGSEPLAAVARYVIERSY